jgi:hypothetical protein
VVLWWIGNIIFLLVVIPVVLLFLNRVLRPTMEINAYANDILDHGVKLTGALDAVPKLAQTRQLTATARQNAERYIGALGRVMG